MYGCLKENYKRLIERYFQMKDQVGGMASKAGSAVHSIGWWAFLPTQCFSMIYL